MSQQVFKIKFDSTLRRVCVPLQNFQVSYFDLEHKVRELFNISSKSQVIMTYTDEDNDIVTMADDQDLIDACLTQHLNPLRLEVKTMAIESTDKVNVSASSPYMAEFDVEGLLKGILPETFAKEIDQILNRYPPYLFSSVPVHVLPEALDTFLKTLTSYGYPEAEESRMEGFPALCTTNGSMGSGHLVHEGVVCDQCEMTPIQGPRYKSLKKHDYDLCSHCFGKVGNASDYHRIDHSMIPKNKQQDALASTKRSIQMASPFSIISSLKEDKNMVGKLNAEFIADITIPDGTVLVAGTKLTKIWRLHNSGMLPWPQQTQLIHVGGHVLGSDGIANLKLPECGLRCGTMIDIPVKLVSPSIAGRYIAYWRLMAPSGEMFGDEVWVLIDVIQNEDKKLLQKNTLEDSYDSKHVHTTNVASNLLIIESDNLLEDLKSSKYFTDLSASVNSPKITEIYSQEEVKLPCVQNEVVKESTSNGKSPNPEEFELVEPYRFANGKHVSPSVTPMENQSSCSGSADEDLGAISNTIETEVSQNQNNQFIISTDWDHMLKDLEEMGFCDVQMNRLLLLKNDGSIKRAVKELVDIENQIFDEERAA